MRAGMITIAIVALPAAAHAQSGGVLSPGYLHTWVGGRSPTFGNGVELTWLHYSRPETPDQAFAFGAFTQLSSYGGTHVRYALGGQVTIYRWLGFELGWAHRGAHDDRAPSNALQIAPFVSVGLVAIGAQWTVGFRGEPAELAATLAFKLAVPIYGKLPVLWPGRDLKLGAWTAGGRPLRGEDGIVLPAVTVGARVARPRLDPELRDVLAELWLYDARMEHASVAAFSRLALELLAHGAPRDLVARAHRAAAQEVAHAEACFAMASRYRGRALSAGAMELSRVAVRDLTTVARECFLDGCVGEGVAAAIAEGGARTATDPSVRTLLRGIARDERQHAALAWDVLVFALARIDRLDIRAQPVARAASPLSAARRAFH